MNSSRGKIIAAMARGDFKNPAAKFSYLNSSRGKIIVEMARNKLKEPTSKSDASGAGKLFDFPECNAVELNDYNNCSSSSEPQIITNLETVLISSIPHFADLSEQRNNTDLPEQLVTGEHIVPKSLHPLIQLEKDAVTTSFLRFISKKNVRQFQTAISIFHWVLRSLSEDIETGKYFSRQVGTQGM
ncbi:hypothetical protein JTB14_025490 [Gonioctena quinquepunctata]|nr:hypothetical protein JTB14_025490 [Gonioctena quinquepunctata]